MDAGNDKLVGSCQILRAAGRHTPATGQPLTGNVRFRVERLVRRPNDITAFFIRPLHMSFASSGHELSDLCRDLGKPASHQSLAVRKRALSRGRVTFLISTCYQCADLL